MPATAEEPAPESAASVETTPVTESVSTVVDAVGSDSSALVRKTFRGIEEGLRSQETASITQVVELIREMAVKVESLSVHQVGEILSRDLTTTTKLIKIACTVGYNPDGAEITTINQAIATVGYNRVRDMAISLLLLQNANRRWSTDDFDEIACITLTSALMSETIMETRKSHNPEHAFVAAALRSYGRLLLASFFPDEYGAAMVAGETEGYETALRRAFGMSALDLARELLQRAGLPPALLRFIEEIPDSRFSAEQLSRDDQQLMLVDFTVKLCELLSRLKTQEHFQTGYQELMERYGRSLHYSKEDMQGLLEATLSKVDSYKRQLASPLFGNRIVTNIRACVEQQPLTLRPSTNRSGQSKRCPLNASFTCGQNAERLLRAGLKELEPVVLSKHPDHAVAWEQVTRLLARALELDDTLLLVQPPCSPAFQAEYGFGQQVAAIRPNAILDPSTKSIFTVAITRAQDVVIQNPNDHAIQPFIPGWLKPYAMGGIILLPIGGHEGTFAILMGLARAKHSLALSPKTMDHLRTLKTLLGPLRPKTDPHPPTK